MGWGLGREGGEALRFTLQVLCAWKVCDFKGRWVVFFN